MYKFGPRDVLFWMMFLIIVTFVVLHIHTQQVLEDSAEQNVVLAERLKARVSLDEYRQIVRSYDDLNADLRECVEYMDEQAYLLEQMHVVRRFMPDSTEGEMHQLCEDCSANCEEALDWCYFYREEACYCVDDWEEGLQ